MVAGGEWPGFDLPATMSPDLWEHAPIMGNPWSPLPSTPLGVGGGVRPPSSGQAGLWATMGATTPSSPDSYRWMGNNIWSSPEPEMKLASPGPSDLVEEMNLGSSAGAAATHGIFDPFNTLEIRTGSIWNPTSTGSGMAGWGFGMKKPGEGGGGCGSGGGGSMK